MSLAKRLALSIARLYAYAMAPDDHTAEERREIIDQAGEAIDAANTVVWFEERAKDQSVAIGSTWPIPKQGSFYAVGIGDEERLLTQEGLIEAIKMAKEADASQPEVDDRNSERKNHDEGTTP